MSALALVFLLSVGQTEPIEFDPATTVDSAPRLQVSADYLYWFLRSEAVPPLLTTGPASSTATIGQPGTQLVYGDDRLESRHDDRYVGVRFGLDWWLDDARTFALHGSAFFLERDSSNYTIPWQSAPVISRPYIDATTGAYQSAVVAGPAPGIGQLAGSVNVYSRIELFGQDLGGLAILSRGDGWSVGGILGTKFLQMRERLDITATSRLLPDETTLFGTTDHFHTFDHFYGAQAGLIGELRLVDRLTLRLQGTFGLGADDQEIRTYGDQVYQTPLVRTTKNYGLYVLPSNTGNFERVDFDTVSEASLSLVWNVSRHVTMHLGYSLLVWTNPVRPGDQITPINLSQGSPSGLVGPPQPQIPWKTDLLLVHGANVGLEFRW
jgi:Putative beta barrel porin-7 (BBP7)